MNQNRKTVKTERGSRYHTTSRDNTGPAGVAAVRLCPPGIFFTVYPIISPFFYVLSPMVEFPLLCLLTSIYRTKCEWRGQRGPRFQVQLTTCKNPTAPCSRKTTCTPHACTEYMLQENNLDAARMYGIHRKGGEKEQCCILLRLKIKECPSRITWASQLLGEWLYSLPGRFRFLRSFWERSGLHKCSTTC